MRFKLYRQFGALNSPSIFDAFQQGLLAQGHKVVDDNEDISVIWSVLWNGRMSSNQQIYERCRRDNKPIIIIEVGNLKRNVTWRICLNHINGLGTNGMWAAKCPGTLGDTIKVSFADSSDYSTWSYKDEFDYAPDTTATTTAAGGSNDEMHIIVIDELGKFTGTAGSILEKFAGVSKASNATGRTGETNYYKQVVNS